MPIFDEYFICSWSSRTYFWLRILVVAEVSVRICGGCYLARISNTGAQTNNKRLVDHNAHCKPGNANLESACMIYGDECQAHPRTSNVACRA